MLTEEKRLANFLVLRMMRVVSFWSGCLVLGVLLTPAFLEACAVCVSGVNDPSADAYNWSVLFLMAMPYTILGMVAAWIFYVHRRSEGKQKPPKAPGSSVQLAWIRKEKES